MTPMRPAAEWCPDLWIIADDHAIGVIRRIQLDAYRAGQEAMRERAVDWCHVEEMEFRRELFPDLSDEAAGCIRCATAIRALPIEEPKT